MRKVLSVLGVLAALVGASLVSGNPDPITADDFVGCLDSYGCGYDIVWDGWKGTLTLKPDGTGSLEQITPRRATYSVRHAIMLNPQNVVIGLRGPGDQVSSNLNHRIVFWVDFNKTPNNPKDDQRFDGYIMTQTKDAIAGITWWGGVPFGFYATNKREPLI